MAGGSGAGEALRACVHNPVVVFLFNLFRWVPVLFIVAVVCWSYYAYVIELCFLTITWVPEKVVYLIGYHLTLVFFLWAYYQTIFAEIARPTQQFFLPREVLDELEQAPRPSDHRLALDRFSRDRRLPVHMRAFDGAIRYCDKCRCVKPDRCHHCSVCGHCVLKFDHHCPWVNTCVSFRNYKFFIQFLGYSLVFCLYVFLTDIPYFIWFWQEGLQKEGASKFHIMFMFFVSGMFAISVSTLFVYHLWLSSRNRSTIESFRAPVFTYGPDANGFNLGWRRNVLEVFGPRPPLWFLPLFSSRGDGCNFSVPNLEYAAEAAEGWSGGPPPAGAENGPHYWPPRSSPYYEQRGGLTDSNKGEDAATQLKGNEASFGRLEGPELNVANGEAGPGRGNGTIGNGNARGREWGKNPGFWNLRSNRGVVPKREAPNGFWEHTPKNRRFANRGGGANFSAPAARRATDESTESLLRTTNTLIDEDEDELSDFENGNGPLLRYNNSPAVNGELHRPLTVNTPPMDNNMALTDVLVN